MAFNKAGEEKKWKIRKDAEERLMRKLGVKEEIIKQLRIYDWNEFNSEQRFYRRLVKTDTYINHLMDEERERDVYTVEDLLDSIEDEQLFKALCKVDKLTLQIMLLKIQGYSTRDIAMALDVSVKLIYGRMSRFRKKLRELKQ